MMALKTFKGHASGAADRHLAKRALRGDRAAFDQLFDDTAPRLHRFASARLGNDAELTREVVQSTLYKGVANLRKYRGEAAFFSWLCGICRFEIMAQYKARGLASKHVELVEEAPEVRAALETLLAVPTDPEENLHRQEMVRLVHVALDHLPSRYSSALEWKYCEGLSVKTIAERLETSTKAAESVLTRAREAFREAFLALGQTAPPSES